MSCPTEYCISNTNHPEYNDNFTSNGDYDGYPSWLGLTNGYYIYFNTTNTQWCLSSSLGGPCLLSGKSPCTSECPDLNNTYLNSGICLTPTPTPTNNCDILTFDSFFDCEFNPTPTPTQTPTNTPTQTITPSSTNYCSIVDVVATITSYSPTPTPTPTMTPSSSGTIDRPCHFYGDATFNTVDEMINCPISKQFQDCYNGTMYYTTNNTTNPSGGDITQYMVFNALVDGLSKCISYVGTATQIIGVNNITLTSGPHGYANLGGCISCNPIPTSTCTCIENEVVIGTQTWSCRNLDVSTYRNGDPIPQVTDPLEWSNLTTGAWCYYDNNSSNNTVYGKLYNWFAINDPRGLAPIGYHIPNSTEWTNLTDYVGGDITAGSILKVSGNNIYGNCPLWSAPSTSTNERGFTALPGGLRNDDGNFYGIHLTCRLWTSSNLDGTHAYYRSMAYTTNDVHTGTEPKAYAMSVRVIKD
jgi:uncharacterized protein (TIGR02145 family)